VASAFLPSVISVKMQVTRLTAPSGRLDPQRERIELGAARAAPQGVGDYQEEKPVRFLL
jgi:hypothetical protein